MNANMLFAKLVQHLTNYNDAAVLWTLLKERADCKEIGVSVNEIAGLQLCSTVAPKTVHRTIEKLQQMGFITVRVQHKSKTLVTVNREAVLDLLNQPLPERLPACSKKTFPFLDAWNARLEAKSESNDQPSD